MPRKLFIAECSLSLFLYDFGAKNLPISFVKETIYHHCMAIFSIAKPIGTD